MNCFYARWGEQKHDVLEIITGKGATVWHTITNYSTTT